MLGAYFAMTIYQLTGSYRAGDAGGAARRRRSFGLLFERVFISRVYGADVLMQLLVCYAFVLIFDDVVQDHLGPGIQVDGHARRRSRCRRCSSPAAWCRRFICC